MSDWRTYAEEILKQDLVKGLGSRLPSWYKSWNHEEVASVADGDWWDNVIGNVNSDDYIRVLKREQLRHDFSGRVPDLWDPYARAQGGK